MDLEKLHAKVFQDVINRVAQEKGYRLKAINNKNIEFEEGEHES